MQGRCWNEIVSVGVRRHIMVAVAVLALTVVATPLAAQTAECDRLAASPLDTSRPAGVPGVALGEMDANAAIPACTQALAEHPGDPRIEYQLARALQQAKTAPERVFALYREAADGGSIVAINNLARMYDNGEGVQKDEVEATRLFRKAAELGLPIAMNNIAGQLVDGTGVAKDEVEALEWYRKAAELGDVFSMTALGRAYGLGGLGLTPDDAQARDWFKKAAAAGSVGSRALLERLGDLDAKSVAEIQAVEVRLIDAKCYTGDVDGKSTLRLHEAIEACPDQRPQLRIETGMHTAVINSIGVDAACTLAATASDDKTVRLWSLPEGRLLRVLRWPIGAGNGGKVYATAVSPNGRFVAAGGWDAEYNGTLATKASVTIFDAATGAIVARPGGFENVVDRLAFSNDGRWVVATIHDGAGIRMIDASNWREVAADKAYGGDSYGAVFGPDGRLYTTSFDGKIRRYGPGPAFIKEGEVVTRGGKQPYAIDIDPDGGRIAVGFDDGKAVEFYDARTLRYRGDAEAHGPGNGSLASVAARGDGRAWLAGGTYGSAGSRLAFLFDHDGYRLGRPLPLAQNTITDLKSCGDGFAVAAADPAFGLLDASGAKRLWRAGVTADMRDKLGDAFMVSADARRVRFGLEYGATTPVTFDLTRVTLSDSPEAPSDLTAPKIEGLPVQKWEDTTQPRLASRAIPLKQYETSLSLAIRPNNDGFVLGANFALRAFDAGGQQRWEAAIPGIAWGVTLSADGQLIVAAYGDRTIRWHRWSDGKELLALFVNKDTRAWVAWTPSGYYAASPGGEDMIGWHVNRGWAQAADFFPASRFRDTYSRPDIVEKVLDTLDEGEAIRQANDARGGRQAPATPITDRLPPVVSILSPSDGASVDGDLVKIDYLVRSPSGLPVDAIEALVDGRPASTDRGLGRLDDTADPVKACLVETKGAGRTEGALQGCRGSLMVHLPPGASEVGLFARSGDHAGDVVKVRLVRATAAKGDEILKPKLYALVVGISAYANKDYALGYAAKDAEDFAAALDWQKGGLYGEVTVRVLTDGQATGTAIKDGLDWLTKQVTSRDVGLVYLAGHGVLDERDRFYFLAADSDAARLRATAVPREDISDALDALAGKALLFLDACHSGAIAGTGTRRELVDINSVVNEFTRTERGVVAFTASTGRQVSQENAAWGNGAFTKAVIEGLGLPGHKAAADYRGDGEITTSELDAYVSERVKGLTGGEQSPVMIRPPTVPDFPLAVAR